MHTIALPQINSSDQGAQISQRVRKCEPPRNQATWDWPHASNTESPPYHRLLLGDPVLHSSTQRPYYHNVHCITLRLVMVSAHTASQKEMVDARLPLQWRDGCSAWVSLSSCRRIGLG